MPRTDIHAPRNMDPANYTLLLEADMGTAHEPGATWFEVDANDPRLQAPGFDGHFAARLGCDHCGAHGLRYIAQFFSEADGRIVTTGLQCAIRLGLTDRSEVAMMDNLEQARRRAAAERWVAEAPVNALARDFLAAHADAHHGQNSGDAFLLDVYAKLRRYGSLSERQVAAVLRSRDRMSERDARRAAEALALESVPPLPEGRRSIAGEVVSMKFQDDDFGGRWKMLVREPDGNKVWGSIPAAINPEQGDRVEFVATVKRSDRDPHFGFFSRPTNAIVTD